MVIRRLFILAVFFVTFTPKTNAQLSATIDGYVSNMQSVLFEQIDGQWTNDNLLHNRLNFSAFWGNNLTIKAEFRNRFLFGETVKYFPDYDEMIGQDKGWLDLSWNILSDSSFLLNSSLDRLYADLSIGKFQITAGRQRINWGVNFVWNPNDIFNSYSFFDFDYVERPGSDAIRMQYYLKSTASFEVVGKINAAEQISLAGLWRFNLLGTDIQLLGGILNEEEYVIGAGASGNLGLVSLSGEITYLDPKESGGILEEAVIAGAGISYNTPFNLFIQAEYLYNQAAEKTTIGSFTDFYYRNMSLRDLSFSPHTFFASFSYPVTVLVNLGLSAMLFPNLNGLFVGPTIDLSLKNNLDLSFLVQHFTAELSGKEEQASLVFLRLKWSF